MSDSIFREINIGQHFIVGFDGVVVNEAIKSLIQGYHVGSVILMKRNVSNFRQVHDLVNQLQQLAKDSGHERPLLIGIDQENGLVSAFSLANGEAGTQFPGAMALAATNSRELVEAVSSASAQELKAAGINVNFSPVADVNSDERNPVIGVRSFGDVPERVADYALAVANALIHAGVAPSAKHFPGHGDTHVDSHVGLPKISKSSLQLMQTEIPPFRLLIDNKIPSIMTAHVALPDITGDDTPSSLCSAITTDLLRNALGFEGVVVTDCLEMEAVLSKYGAEQGALRALIAGADIAMICHTMERQMGALKTVLSAVQSGELDASVLAKSSERINALKDKYAGSWKDVLDRRYDPNCVSQLKKKSEAISARAYAASTALILDAEHTLPLSAKGKVVVLTPMMESLNAAVDDADGVDRFDVTFTTEATILAKNGKIRNTAGASYIAFAASIASRAASSQHFVYAPNDKVPHAVSEAASVIFVTRNSDRSQWQIDYLRSVLKVTGVHGSSVVLLASCAPYDLLLNSSDIPVSESEASSPKISVIWGEMSSGKTAVLDPLLDNIKKVAYLASFEYTAPALEAAAGVIFGEKKATGVVPVLDGKVLATSTFL